VNRRIPLFEGQFDTNDIFIISSIVILYLLIFLLPKLFLKKSTSFLLIFYSITVASIFDNSIGAHIFDYYDIMDGKKYTIMDLVVYLVYGPFGYFFIYIYERYKIRGHWVLIYLLAWTFVSLLFEFLNVRLGVFTYKNGYKWYFSIPIYMYVQLLLFYLYKLIIKENKVI
jgi:hypothetical protein